MNARLYPITTPITSPVDAVTCAEALAASLGGYRPTVRHELGTLVERAAEATATYQAITEPVEDYEAPLYDAPEPYCPVDRNYRARSLCLLIVGLSFIFLGSIWLIGLLFIAFT